MKSSLSRHLLNLKVLLTLRALKLYTSLSSTSTTNCFTPMFKRKLDRHMMNCDNRLRCLSETLTNWHWMLSVKNSSIRDTWLYMTCSDNKIWTMSFLRKHFALNRDAYLNGRDLSGRLLYVLHEHCSMVGDKMSTNSVHFWGGLCS